MDLEQQNYRGLYWTLWRWADLKGWLLNIGRVIWVTAQNLYVIPAHCLWMALIWIPITSLAGRDTYLQVEEYFFRRILGLVGSWGATAGYKIAESGDRLDDIFHKHRFLFMPNHQSTADVPLCMSLFSSIGLNGAVRGSDKVMWIMDKIFKFTNFGLVAWIHDDFFILAGKDNRDKSLVELKDHLRDVFLPKKRRCLVMFPEGGFLKKRKPVSHRFASKNNLPLLEYCTLPRTGALEVIIDCLVTDTRAATTASNGSCATATADYNSNGSSKTGTSSPSTQELLPTSDTSSNSTRQRNNAANGVVSALQKSPTSVSESSSNVCEETLSKIVDVTIAYPERDNPLDLLDIIAAVKPPCTTHVHYRVFDIKDVPTTNPEELRHWMYRLYIEKEAMLEEFYRTGVFPHKMFDKQANPPTVLRQSYRQVALTNIFYFLSSLGFYWLGSSAYRAVF